MCFICCYVLVLKNLYNKNMKIRELKPKYMKLAIKNQLMQGNSINLDVTLEVNKYGGNFTFEETPEGLEFWSRVEDGDNPKIPKINS